jgi:hypothetical protein
MTDTKICMDCGRQFNSKSNESTIICQDCVALLKRRFWSSIRIGKAYDNITDII